MLPDDEIFGEALARSAVERMEYLRHACAGNPMQQARIEELLIEDAAAVGFLGIRPGSLADWRPAGGEQIGDLIGPYRLVAAIGEGGWGVVYRAEQREPVRREVALKVIRAGLDERSVVTRFEAERQALALMDHPGIARVLDAGTTDAGRPYFAMELVAGVPITTYCDRQNAGLRRRLELFVAVCLAVQHAHQKGVIHRDLKPSNILVAELDGTPQPKVIDFGIAKATQGRLTEETLHTRLGQFIGTPNYMSPEQAELGAVDIDTRSDIYSLGALLYRLLTGRTPLDSGGQGLAETWRAIRELDPPRPSAAIASLSAEEAARVARARASSPAQLVAALRGDLDWIVMRCLEKDRARRYETAQDLAEDVRRHLRREPVLARPPDAAYRIGRFVARHRTASVAVAAVAVSLLAGTVVSVWQAVRAVRAEKQAVAERNAATEARADAQRLQTQAEETLAFMLGAFRTDLKKLGRLDLLDTVGGRALAYFDALPARDLTDSALARQAKALTQIGEIRMDQHRYPEAERVFTTAYERAAGLAARHPDNGELAFERAQAEFWIGAARRARGDLAGAESWMQRYRDTAAAQVARDPGSAKWRAELVSGHHNLAVLELDRGDFAAARAGFLAERAALAAQLETSADDADLRFRMANVDSWLGEVADRSGDLAEAMQRCTATRAALEGLVAAHPGTAQWTYKLADSLLWEAEELAVTGRPEEAAQRLAQARTIIDPLVERDPANRRWLLASLDVVLGEAALARGEASATRALERLAGGTARLERLAAADAADANVARRLVIAAWRTAELQQETGHGDLSATVARAVMLAEALAKRPNADSKTIAACAQAFVVAARMHTRAGEGEAARRAVSQAFELLSPRLEGATDRRLLVPALAACVLDGRTEQAQALARKLWNSGFRAFEPWLPGSVLGR